MVIRTPSFAAWISLLRERPKGFAVALWKPSRRSPLLETFALQLGCNWFETLIATAPLLLGYVSDGDVDAVKLFERHVHKV